MKVIQSLGWYHPESWGGTEAYVAALARELSSLGVSSVIAAPAAKAWDGSHDGHAVHRYPVEPQQRHAQVSGAQPHGGFRDFEDWLAGQDAVLYHQHSWTYGCGLHHLQAARSRGLQTVLTVHVPGPACPRGTMLHGGTVPCEGMTSDRRCAACWLQSRGAPAAAQAVLPWVPPAAGALLRPWGRVGTALAARAYVQSHRASLLQAAAAAGKVVAVCQWLHDALRVAGVPSQKLLLCRQGVPLGAGEQVAGARRAAPGGRLRVGFLGRWDPTKGQALLVEALLRLPRDTPMELRLHGLPPADAAGQAWHDAVRSRAALRPDMITLGPALAPAEVGQFLREIDVLAVPSQWLETGPLVVLEALQAGTPVIGSDLGGIAELVQDGRTGRLVRHDDVDAWASALRELAAQPERLAQWRRQIGRVRTMADVAGDMANLYADMLQQSRERAA